MDLRLRGSNASVFDRSQAQEFCITGRPEEIRCRLHAEVVRGMPETCVRARLHQSLVFAEGDARECMHSGFLVA
jgi:hypothetical protein